MFCSITPLFLSAVAGVPGIRAPEVFRTLKRTEREKDRVSEDMRVTLGEETLRFSCRTESLGSWTHLHTSTHSCMHTIGIYCENSAFTDTFKPIDSKRFHPIEFHSTVSLIHSEYWIITVTFNLRKRALLFPITDASAVPWDSALSVCFLGKDWQWEIMLKSEIRLFSYSVKTFFSKVIIVYCWVIESFIQHIQSETVNTNM